MKINLKTLALIAIAGLTIVACKKKDDDDDTPAKTTKTDMLTANNWVWTNMKLAPPLDTIDVWSTIDVCDKDDVISFNKNGNGTTDEGVTKCEPTDPQTESFKWTWLNSETQLRIVDNDMDTTLLENVSITATTMTGQTKIDEVPLGVIIATMTFSKK